MSDLVTQLRQGVRGLQRLRQSAQLERQLQAHYAHLGQLYADGRSPEELETVRGEILRLRSELQQTRAEPLPTAPPQELQPPAPLDLQLLPPVSGMAARIWQAKEEERDEGESAE